VSDELVRRRLFGLWLAMATVPLAWRDGLSAQEATLMSDNEVLARLVEPIDPHAARLIGDPRTEVERLETPFLVQGRIFRVVHNGPYRPIGFTVGYAQFANWVVLLSVNVGGFEELAARAGVKLDSDALRQAYAITLLETTRSFERPFKVLRRWADVRPFPVLAPAQEERLATLRARYEPQIALTETRGAGPWRIPLFVLSGYDLELHTVTLRPDGRVAVATRVLETETPLLPAN
jgi:hypothetical protein